MELEIVHTIFIIFAFYAKFCTKSASSSVEACLPRIGLSIDKFSYLSVFGQKHYDTNTNKSYYGETQQKSMWTTNDWIQKHKYTLEMHNVMTEDGYHLQLHRMPHPGYRPILLVHGPLTSSLSWVLMGPKKSLAFILFDKHYDVWLANFRGSSYGRNHTRYSTSDANFWSFSFHEMGIYDIPAILDYIRSKSSFHQVILIVHSQAFNAVLVTCSMYPEYNDRILFIQALAPIAKLKNNVKINLAQVKRIMTFIKNKTKSEPYEIFPTGYLKTKCLKRNSGERQECQEYTKLIAGSGQSSSALNPTLFGSLLRGGSFKEIQHLYQIWQSGDFVAYDYDVKGNWIYYNSVEPYNYNLTQVKVPMILHFGETDAIASPAGVHQIYSHLLNSNIVLGVYRVATSEFNHLDFICSYDIKTLVNDKIIYLMEQYLSGKLQYVIE